MRTPRKLCAIIAAAAVAVGTLSTVPFSTSNAASAAEPPATSMVGGEGSTCFWHYGGIGADPLYNIAYPDAGATYWAAYYRRPVGSTLTLKGRYPHSRYFSFISYDRAGQPLDGIADYQIRPDAGSRNPYKPGARRDTPATKRHFTVSLDHVQNVDPSTGAPLHTIRDPRNNEPVRNDLSMVPTPALGQAPLGVEVGEDGVSYETELLLMRVYIPDRGKDIRGGFRLPAATLTLADGTVLTGRDACDATDSQSREYSTQHDGATRLPDPAALTLSEQNYRDLRYPNLIDDSRDMLPNSPGVQVQVFPATNAKTPTSYAAPPPGVLFQTKRDVPSTFPATYDATLDGSTVRSTRWTPQYSRAYLLQAWTGQDAIGATATPQRTGGGFFPNLHNNYVRAELHRKFGKVAVIRGKIASSPKTYGGEKRMGTGQVRYTSFCMNESVYTTRVMDCVYDEEVPTDKRGNYTIVVSRPEDRPKYATRANGIAWIKWSKKGDGYQDGDFGWFQIRNMIPDVGFNRAVQNTQKPGDEIAVMGRYLPNITYTSPAAFNRSLARR